MRVPGKSGKPINDCGDVFFNHQTTFTRRKTVRAAALYARVSSRNQAEAGTISSQIAALEAYAEAHDMHIAPEHRFVDEGVSGRFLARRGLDSLRDAVLTQAFEVVLCLSPDRLARDIGAQQIVLYELRRQGVEIHFLNQPTLSDSAEARLWQQMQGVLAEWERNLIQDRMRRGRRYRLQQGLSVPIQAPYGYQYQKAQGEQRSQWLVIEQEANIVRMVFSWYAEAGMKVADIAQRLNEAQIPSPAGKQWGTSTLLRLLQQPAYKGVAYYGRTQADYSVVGQPRKQGRGRLLTPRYQLRPVEEWILVNVPPLVSEELWQAAQERRAMHTRYSQRNSHRQYLFRSLLVCGVCGYTLQGRTSRKGRVKYHCTHGGKHRPPDVPEHRCSVDEATLESLLWQDISALLRQPERIQRAWEALFPAANPEQRTQRERRRKQLQKRRQRLLKAYEAEVYSLEELQKALTPVMAELQAIERAEADDASPGETPSLAQFQEGIKAALAATDFETRQEVIRLLIERILVTDDAFIVEYLVPLSSSGRLEPTFRET